MDEEQCAFEEDFDELLKAARDEHLRNRRMAYEEFQDDAGPEVEG